MAKKIHTEFHKGSKVFVIFRDGTKVVDRWEAKKSGVVILRKLGRVKTSTLRSLTIFREAK